MKDKLIKYAKAWWNERAYRRVAKLNRYMQAKIPFLGKTIVINDSVTFLHSRQEIFIDEGYKFNATTNSPLIIDCGANIGLSVLYFKTEYPNCRIIAFEPDPELYNILLTNIKAFELENVTAIEAACWIEDGFLPFQKEGAHSGSISNFWDNSKKIQVTTENLSKYLNQTVDLLKIDIEGAEYDVLISIRALLPNVRNLVFEYHSSRLLDQKLGDLLNLLKEAGFRYHIKETFTRKHPLIDQNEMLNMDLQLNVYATRQ